MQQTVVEYIDPTLKAQVEEDILTLLGLTHSEGQRLTSPHHQNLSEAENHTVGLLEILANKSCLYKMIPYIFSIYIISLSHIISAVYLYERYI